jgi:uncharacterized protein with ParB-like and HNH nuclease domain
MQQAESLCKTVEQLEGFKFVIPSYQRGYRWTEDEVSDLLNDINDFNTNEEKLFYYLQPLIVLKSEDNKYEVVDGQQRLTTIYIFMKILSVKEPYSLEYKTRKGSEEYLQNLSAVMKELDDSNIDYYHITWARNTINKWLGEHTDKSAEKMQDKLNRSTRFIWYELPKGSDPIAMFRKINIGKIPLTNAELIKALLLSKDNFNSDDITEIEKRQHEISIEWDMIERSLHKDDFWYFLNAGDMPTRIDIIFKLLAHKHNNKPDSNKYFAFRAFSKKIEAGGKKIEIINKIWEDVKQIFDEFCDWYENTDKYHIIGYLVHCGVSIKEVYDAVKDKKKRDILPCLKKLANNTLTYKKKNPTKEQSEFEYFLSELSYNTDKEYIKKLLLLFNVASLVRKSENGDSLVRKSEIRFPFDLYTKGKWDIEHIHAIKDALPNKTEDAKEYLEALKDEFEQPKHNEIADEIKKLLEDTDLNLKNLDDSYKFLCEKYNKIPGEDNNILGEDNTIGNLTLLNREINRSYQDATFRRKRKVIIEKDSEGCFLPLCTKNIFLKYYSTDIKNPFRWTEDDRTDYVKKILEIIGDFFKEIE